MFTIFTLAFKIVHEPDTDYAIWLEANGKKRYCAGPKGKGDCTAARTQAEENIAEGINEDMLNLGGTSPTRRRGLNETISYHSESKADRVGPLAGMMMMES